MCIDDLGRGIWTWCASDRDVRQAEAALSVIENKKKTNKMQRAERGKSKDVGLRIRFVRVGLVQEIVSLLMFLSEAE